MLSIISDATDPWSTFLDRIRNTITWANGRERRILSAGRPVPGIGRLRPGNARGPGFSIADQEPLEKQI
jgi:hypothetical protein